MKQTHAAKVSLLPVATWDALCGKNWPCYYWGDFTEEAHAHYRHPQVLVFEDGEFRSELIGLHPHSNAPDPHSVNAGALGKLVPVCERYSGRRRAQSSSWTMRIILPAPMQ